MTTCDRLLPILAFSSVLIVAATVWETGKVKEARTGSSAEETQWLIMGTKYSYVVATPPPTRLMNFPHTDTNPAVQALKHPRREYCRFVVGDPVKYSQNRGVLVAVDADGRRCVLDILSQERLNAK